MSQDILKSEYYPENETKTPDHHHIEQFYRLEHELKCLDKVRDLAESVRINLGRLTLGQLILFYIVFYNLF